ncbi:hypothetical protein CAQUA_03465 [Corynebacterium aquatimens]|nr:hypothetical protein CAQUA_03465 [Corynebacterium aquatimens]
MSAAAALALSLTGTAIASAGEITPVSGDTQSCVITYTEAEIPVLAAASWSVDAFGIASQFDGGDNWRDGRTAYLANKETLRQGISKGQNTVTLTMHKTPLEPRYEEHTVGDVWKSLFDTTSSITPARSGREPYELIAFRESAASWVEATIANCGKPAPTQLPTEPAILKSATAPGLAPKEAIGVVMGLLVALGFGAALVNFVPILPALQTELDRFLGMLPR